MNATVRPKSAVREIFAIHGLAPEVLAVAMAKYSRSRSSIKETIEDLTNESTSEFHEKWVLGYGDASVADMAMIAIACENVSILASKVIEDNRIASYQEKSTRYQSFDSDRYIKPDEIARSKHGAMYIDTMELLFAAYRKVTDQMEEYYRKKYPNKDPKRPKTHEKKLHARALDVSRYCLPVGTLTNFGMIMSARSLRHCISKALGHECPEVRAIGEEIRSAAMGKPYHPREKKIKFLLEALSRSGDGAFDLCSQLQEEMNVTTAGAPTLVKYCAPKEYLKKSFQKLLRLGSHYCSGLLEDESYRARYFQPKDVESELVSTLLYAHSRASYRQIGKIVERMGQKEKEEIISAGIEDRGPFDWPRREFEIGGLFSFDTLMDYGAFRDLQRHRLTTQINQPFTIHHGFEIPDPAKDAGLEKEFERIMTMAKERVEILAQDFPIEATYMIPMAYRKRTLFKMNLRELYHIIELRTKPGGHFSYRALCYEMFEEVKKYHPSLAAFMRPKQMNFDVDFYDR